MTRLRPWLIGAAFLFVVALLTIVTIQATRTHSEQRKTSETLAHFTALTVGSLPDGTACPLGGLVEYPEEDTHEVYYPCIMSAYLEACDKAIDKHNQTCTDHCKAFEKGNPPQKCLGLSSPLAEAYDESKHCKIIIRGVETSSPGIAVHTCTVRGECRCDP